jgi:ferritin-like metal-binding protein YciE
MRHDTLLVQGEACELRPHVGTKEYAEKHIVKALPNMIEKSDDPQLKHGFRTHLAETENHIKQLEKVFLMHGKEPAGVDCPAIDGTIEGGRCSWRS